MIMINIINFKLKNFNQINKMIIKINLLKNLDINNF